MGQRMRAIGRAREPDRLGRCGNEPVGESAPIDETEGLDTIVAHERADRFDEHGQGHTLSFMKTPEGTSTNERQRIKSRTHDQRSVQVATPIGPQRHGPHWHRRHPRDSLGRRQCIQRSVGEGTAIHRDADEKEPENEHSQQRRMTPPRHADAQASRI